MQAVETLQPADRDLREALLRTKPFRCRDCGGKASVRFGRVRVFHDLPACPLGNGLRRRFPALYTA